MSDSFKKEFDVLRELGEQTFVLRGSTIIVEVLEPEEIKTAGGLFVATDSKHTRGGSVTNHRVDVGRVLMCGQGYWTEGSSELTLDNPGYFEKMEVQPGAIILLPQHSAQLLSHFPGINRPTSNKLALIKFDQVLAYYPNEAAYADAKAKLNV